ncbi:hypothetical protein BH23PAT1_BH23PAT1_3410 [soil metagenome]
MFDDNDNQNQQSDDHGNNPGLPQPATEQPVSDDNATDTSAVQSVTPQDFTNGAPAVADDTSQTDTVAAPVAQDDLLNIKQEALQSLSPLVGHLEQTPEEKFRTTMMMIQASDDQSLVKAAYEAAKQITDEKIRAQALLDVVNEINYFTQQHNK